MLTTYSSHRDGGGTLHLHSPTHIHMDAGTAIRELRRSLSRSPSKLNDYRKLNSRSQSPSAVNPPFSPSPLSPSRRSTSDNSLNVPTVGTTPTHAVPFPPSARTGRSTLRRTLQSHNLARGTRTSPRSPSNKRPLTEACGNSITPTVSLRKRSSTDVQHSSLDNAFSQERDKENEDGLQFLSPLSASNTKSERRLSGAFITRSSTVSPMKRNDGPVNLERCGLERTPAKRRSLHAPGADFSIFEPRSLGDESERRSFDDSDSLTQEAATPVSSYFNTIPKRSSSLRKSTLQQRQFERPSNGKVSPTLPTSPASPSNMDQQPLQAQNPPPKKGQRFSLDNHLPPVPRESPFASQGSLLNASIHPLGPGQSQGQSQAAALSASQTRHPLSRTMTQSSSTSSFADDSPTHEPIHRTERPKSMFDFSKSLPIGSARPIDTDDEPSQSSSQGVFATPANYKSAKPLPAAFMSTGLISKKNRNVDELQDLLPKAHMPDTPCKKPFQSFPDAANFAPTATPAAVKQPRHSFGTPSTPLNSHRSVLKPAPRALGRGVGIFGTRGGKGALQRKASFASLDGDDKSQSQSPPNHDSQTSTDSEFPPTPTKGVLATSNPVPLSVDVRSSKKVPPPTNAKSNAAVRLASSKTSIQFLFFSQ